MKKNIWATPPKKSKILVKIGNKEIPIKIVRDSVICRLFSNNALFVFDRTIYVRNKILVRKVLVNGLKMIEQQERVGKLKYLWFQVVKGR